MKNNLSSNNSLHTVRENDEHHHLRKEYAPLQLVDPTRNTHMDVNLEQPPSKHSCPQCRILARTVLWYLTFVGFAINYMIRINLNITIVDMVMAKNRAPSTELPSPDTAKLISFAPEHWLLEVLGIQHTRTGFVWDERQQGALLGSFFWLYWSTQIPGGLLARRYGTKLVFGLSNLLGCLLCFALPLAAYLDHGALIALRVLQGLVCGVAWPAMHTMTGRWIPPNERSKFVTAYMGSSVGVAVFYPLFGVVMSCTSWEWVYHLCGTVGVVWSVAWWWLVFDTPAQHPRICREERWLIERSLGSVVSRTGGTPWRAILTSRPVLMICVAQWGCIWALFTLMTQAPTYFRNVHGWTMSMTGVLSGLPHLLRTAFAMGFSMFGDWLLRGERMSRTNVRKLAGAVCLLVGAAFVLALAFVGDNAGLAVVWLVAGTAMLGAVSTGPLASLVDLSPNYSGITLGLAQMVAVMPGFISPYIVGRLGNETSEEWKYVFLIAAVTMSVCGLIYVLFSESDLQPWNTPLSGRNSRAFVERRDTEAFPLEHSDQKPDGPLVSSRQI